MLGRAATRGVSATGAILVLASWSQIESASGASEAQRHPVGISETPGTRLVVKDVPLTPPRPMFPGERFVLTTVGSEHQTPEGTEFHPLVSVLVDYSFSEAPQGRWLALWNLGHFSPSAGDHVGAAFPVLLSSKKSSPGTLRKLEKKRRRLEANPSRAGSELPRPFLKATQKHYRANEHMVLQGIKKGLGAIVGFWTNVGPVTYSASLLYRNYLLRHNDMKERQFEHAYLGLTWYTDLATHTLEADSLSAETIADLKFKLLASRHLFGRWVKEEQAENFVHGFDSKMREQLWGTSCLLASIANQHNLAYEEFRRYTAGGVPVALGGVLYYDSALAPAPSQVRWPSFNPFDLTHNPFENPDVLQAASSGDRVPLAIYVYQSNLTLKPIIAVDFFDPDNPRAREAATYLHQLGDEALAVHPGKTLYYWIANKGGSFLANRKGLSLFSDSKHSLGLEELRLSLLSHLYFDEEPADGLLDSIDRLLINPLTQPSRVQALRARIQYLRLARPGPLLRWARALRAKQIRGVTGIRGRVGEREMASYRRYLKRRREIRPLRVFLRDEHLPSIPPDQIDTALANLHEEARDPDPELVDFLLDFRLALEQRSQMGRDTEQAGWLSDIDKVLARLYESEGRSPQLLAADLRALDEERARIADKEEEEHRKRHLFRIERLTKRRLLVLQQFVESGGDLMTVSPWYLREALEFFSRAPLAIDLYPQAGVKFREQESEIIAYVRQAREYLAFDTRSEGIPWMEEEKALCLQAADLAHRQLTQSQRAGRLESGPVEVAESHLASEGNRR